MCGIFGILRRAPDTVEPEEARRGLDLMRHRGPDDEGYVLVRSSDSTAVPCGGRDTEKRLGLPELESVEGGGFNVILGHRRLSIIDLSPAGHQPMVSGDGRFWIVYNGEVYNYVELREQLSSLGYRFRTSSDTEVLLAAYCQWGHRMLERFVGMFGLAILDIQERSLFLARDFFGIKPLYYTLAGGQFAFSSEIKPLLELSRISRRGDPQRLYHYASFGLTDFGGKTLFADIRQLPSAHYLSVRLDDPSDAVLKRYWKIDLSRRADLSLPEAMDHLRHLFEDSVRLHLRSDVSVGSCLSGGLDSSAIVMIMDRLLEDGKTFHTFSYIMDDPVLGEEPFVDLVARSCSSISNKTRFGNIDFSTDLEQLIFLQEEPFMSTSVYAQHLVFRLAREAGIKVMLDGQGADEIFGGYYSLIGARISSLLYCGRVPSALRVAAGAPGNLSDFRWKMMAMALARLLPQTLVARSMSMARSLSFPAWLDMAWLTDRGVQADPRMYGKGKDSFREELLLSVEALSLPQLLRYEDRNSMHFSIESRVPFCTPALAEFAFSLPEEYLIAEDGTTKVVFREAMRGTVPDPVLLREKVGFATPERDLLEILLPWVERSFREGERSLPFVNIEKAGRDLSSIMKVKKTGFGKLWRLVNIVKWSQIFNVKWD